ncbi:nuclear mRNA export, poly(A)+RNA binding protein [Scheffersomyces xylosifermentans]|uniref:nuclear mRNA export, poly(A)+RNA binding protein n=1 Tax=Scheffersomyces xylosifermentans TaxID=1304137 RepID=UPI00315CC5A2
MSYRGRGRGGFHNQNNYRNNNNNNNQNNNNNYNQQNVDQFVNQNSIPVEILGWNGASSEECINFISRKCKIVVSNFSVDPSTGILKGYVKTQQQANDLLNWSGVKFAGQSLRITKANSPDSFTNKMGGGGSQIPPNSNNTIETITNFLKTRYQPEIKLLNLASVKSDHNLNSQGFFGSISTTSKFFMALMKIAKDLKLDVLSVDLSGNELSDLATISPLAATFPLLQNLSLQNNNFNRLKAFETWRHKLNFLRELLLGGNPLVANQTNPIEINNIKVELMKSFPRLIVLDGEVIRNEELLNNTLSFPFPASVSMFFQDEEIRNMSTNFISNYLKLWDANRADLMILYQNESQFSMQVDSSHPYLIDSNPSHYSSGTDFGNYLSNSRNLTRVSSVKARLGRVAIGQEQIFKSFSQLPKTRHDLMTHPELFSVESYRFPQLNGIMIVIHGSFEETAQPEAEAPQSVPNGPRGRFNNSKNKKAALSKKSFDRTFVVIPGPNGSMIVASDLLSVRPFAVTDAWNVAHKDASPAPANAAIPGPVPPAVGGVPQRVPTPADLPAEVKVNLSPLQQEILVKILLETKLNMQYSIMLCEQSNWDYQQCTINFKNSAATLPREAFTA